MREEDVVRLLIVGGSLLLTWVVRHLVPTEVEVENSTTLKQVKAAFLDHPPDAVLLNVRQTTGPWRKVARECQRQRPPIPVLFHAGAELDPAEAGIAADDHSFFTEQLAASDLDRLIRAAREARGKAPEP